MAGPDSSSKKAAEAMARRSNKKKTAGKSNLNFYIAGAIGGGSVIFACYLAATEGPKRKGSSLPSPLDNLVNDRSFISSTTSESGGNFTAAASPFFDKWTYGDVKYGMDGQVLASAGFVGFAGALQKCDVDEEVESGVLPPAYDFRDSYSACVQEPIDSGNCSAGYAIAAAATVSSRYCMADVDKYGSVKLSAQQVLSCDKKSQGCKGGSIDSVFAYIKRRGLYPEECVKYAGVKGAECKTTCKEEQKMKILDYCALSGDKLIKREIINNGPVVAPVFLHDDFMVYKEGVYSPIDSSRQQYGEDGKPIMVPVTILGWGRSKGVPYWITSNSFGAGWGENGYAHIAMHTVVREDYALVVTPATEEALAAAEKKAEEAAKRKEQAKIERAERDARIRERQAQREAEMRAKQDELDDAEFEDDVDLDLDLDEDETKEKDVDLDTDEM